MKLHSNLATCSALSAIIHTLALLPALAWWLGSLLPIQAPQRKTPAVQVRLLRLRPQLAGQPRPAVPIRGSGGLAVSAEPPRRPARTASTVPIRPEAPVRPALPGPPSIPVASQAKAPVRQARSQSAAVGEGGQGNLEPPVLLRGPQQIPVPPFLRNRDGHFLLTLRCQIAVDGSSRVAIMEGTGAVELDESVCRSFSGLPWYRGELDGQPIGLTVRLVIEGSWKAGEEAVPWGGRIPRQQSGPAT